MDASAPATAAAATAAANAASAAGGELLVPGSFTLTLVLALVALVVLTILIVRAKKPLQLPPLQSRPGILNALRQQVDGGRGRWWSALLRPLQAMRYLTTRREWRYETPWVMLLGEQGAGKSSVAASITSGHRQTLLLREKDLSIEGSQWRFFDGGVVIDPIGELPTAAAGSTDGKVWRNFLSALEMHRPERPLDAIVLHVSARTLLHADYTTRLACAEQCYEQLFTLQKRFDFAYPVYVVVTQCDSVPGFAAFWQPHRLDKASAQAREMWGWSSPSLQDSGSAADNVAAAWQDMRDNLHRLQVTAAANDQALEDGDQFILFPQHFATLEEPLATFLEVVFRPSVYHASFYLRGIYCTASLQADGEQKDGHRDDVLFVDQLFANKVFAETYLARPTRESLWSRNRWLRRLQFAGIGFFVLLALTLATATTQLGYKLQALSEALRIVKTASAEHAECAEKSTIFNLLREVSRTDTDLRYLLIPASWVDSRVMHKSAQDLANGAFSKVVMPSLQCHLEARAQNLLAASNEQLPVNDKPSEEVRQAQEELHGYLRSLLAYEQAEDDFALVAQEGAEADKHLQLAAFSRLLRYVYGEELPQERTEDAKKHAGVLAQLSYAGRPRTPPGFKEAAAERVEKLSAALGKAVARQVLVGAEMAEGIGKEQRPVLALLRRFDDWLGWVGKEWLASSPQRNLCQSLGGDIVASVRQLRQGFDYPASMEASANRFSNGNCYEPGIRQLAAMQLPPYGNLFEKRNGIYVLSAGLEAEIRGMRLLAAEDFMQLQPSQAFSCLSATLGWRSQNLAEADRYIRDYQRFARLSGADTAQETQGSRPLYDRLARRHLQAVLDEILRHGQMPLPQSSALHRDSTEVLSSTDQELAQRSADFTKVVDPLLSTLHLYRQLGFAAPANQITQCVRNFASDMLLKADALAQASRLYEPSSDKGKDGSGEAVYAIGGNAVVKDYLARQLQRSQVLAGYAAPFVSFLKNSEAVDESQQSNNQSASYWDNTLSEVRRYVQFKEPNGQVAHLENMFQKQLADLTYDNCGKVLGGYQGELPSNDFFSSRRRALEQDARWRCNNRREADAYALYRGLATRFNRDLAGRFPFAPTSRRDASPAAVRAFFADYEAQRESLRSITANLSDSRWQNLRLFLDQLDKAAAFFRGNLGAADGIAPVRAELAFRTQAKQSPGSEQIVAWRLSSGTRVASYPNGAATLDWQPGEMLLLELQWAEQSRFRPVADPQQPDMAVEGNVASFASLGDWALLRLLAEHRPKSGVSSTETNQLLVELNVPVSSQKVGPAPGAMSTARAYLGITLSNPAPAADPAKGAAPAASAQLRLPVLPQKAPLFW